MFDPNMHPDQIEAMLNATAGLNSGPSPMDAGMGGGMPPAGPPSPMDAGMGMPPAGPPMGMDPMAMDPMGAPMPSTDPAWIAQQLQGLVAQQEADAQAAALEVEAEQDSALLGILQNLGMLGGFDAPTDFVEGGSLDHLPDVPDEDLSDPNSGF